VVEYFSFSEIAPCDNPDIIPIWNALVFDALIKLEI